MTEGSTNHSAADIPDFDLIREIGRGGFGQVWLARNRATGLLRAVKLIALSPAGKVDPAGREVVSITRLESVRHRHHPNLLDIQHVGKTHEHVYIVTDLADSAGGGPATDEEGYVPATLETRLSAGAVGAAECLDWTRQLLDGLASLHEAGMVHRDVKPANCLFVGGQLKLADFGLLTEADSHSSRIGTQAYMPPDGRMDTRADVYAAGLVIYEMITGYSVERFPQLGGRGEAIAADPGLACLLKLVLKACQTYPEDRFANAAAMRAALEEQTGASRKPARRMVIAAAVTGTLGIAALIAWASYDRTPSLDAPVTRQAQVMPRVHVNFITEPFGATVWIDGVLATGDDDQTLTTPCTIDDLPACPHHVVFKHPEYPDRELESVDFARQRQVVEVWPRSDRNASLQLDLPGALVDETSQDDVPSPNVE